MKREFLSSYDIKKLLKKTEPLSGKLENEFKLLQELVGKLKDLQIDPVEYSCLRGIVMFNPG